MPKSTPNAPPELRRLWRRREGLLAILLSDEPLLVGTVYDVLRRCGNRTCHCAQQPTHRQTLLLYIDRGRRRCRFVRQAQAAQFKQAAQRYRTWRKALRDFLALQKQERGLLRGQIRQRAMKLR